MQIERVTLACRDLEGQLRFYGRTLGLPTIVTPDGSLQVQVGPSELVFQLDNSAAPFYHIAFNIATNQVAAALEWAQLRFPVLDKAGELISHSTDWNADGFYFYDADGNILELIARHTLPEPGPERFGPDQIQCVSEVGLPVVDVPGTVERFARELALPEYDCDRSRFNAMGDEHGLLIVVAAGRNWYPTDRPAQPAPVMVEIRSGVPQMVEIEGPGYIVLANPL